MGVTVTAPGAALLRAEAEWANGLLGLLDRLGEQDPEAAHDLATGPLRLVFEGHDRAEDVSKDTLAAVCSALLIDSEDVTR